MKLHETTDAGGLAPSSGDPTVTDALVDAALRAADELGMDVADVPVIAIARQAGISRSTLLRRLGGSRAALDEAVRARGVDPGGAPPVRTPGARCGGGPDRRNRAVCSHIGSYRRAR